MKYSRTLRVAGAVAAAGAVAMSGTAATADVDKRLTSDSIKMKGDKQPRFDAPETVIAGADLQIVNKTNADKIGPHTFSLVEKDQLPKTVQEMKRCAKFRGVCKDIFNEHEVDPVTFDVGVPNVENGAEGWDAHFDGENGGDTWYTGEEGDTTSRQVTAESNKIFFLCIVHPEMQGKSKVLDLR
jgi:hypothetical protein